MNKTVIERAELLKLRTEELSEKTEVATRHLLTKIKTVATIGYGNGGVKVIMGRNACFILTDAIFFKEYAGGKLINNSKVDEKTPLILLVKIMNALEEKIEEDLKTIEFIQATI